MHEEISLRKFELGNGLDLDLLIECYREVFAWDPWYEWKKCTKCGQKYGKEHKKDMLPELKCPKCGNGTVDFWSKEQVQKDIKNELGRSSSICYLLIENESGKVIGFTWGFLMRPGEFEAHLELEGFARALADFFPNADFFVYQDEIGIIKNYQGRKLATVLFKKLFSEMRERGNTVGVARTKLKPRSLVSKWYEEKLNFKRIMRYNDFDERIILAAELDSISSYLESC
ncbi:GNAT family N-acetyltransferase [bacterium]|nr:GNAT family N-acetyltransferase [bacterium]